MSEVRVRRLTRSAGFAVLALGCGGGGGPDDVDTDTDGDAVAIAGVYQVTSDRASATCDQLEEVGVPIPYLSVVPVGDTIEVRVCRRADDCDTYAESDQILSPTDKGWKAIVTWAYWNEQSAACLLNATRTTLKQPNADEIALEGVGTNTTAAAPGKGAPDDAACEKLLPDWTPSFAGETQDCWARKATRVTD